MSSTNGNGVRVLTLDGYRALTGDTRKRVDDILGSNGLLNNPHSVMGMSGKPGSRWVEVLGFHRTGDSQAHLVRHCPDRTSALANQDPMSPCKYAAKVQLDRPFPWELV